MHRRDVLKLLTAAPLLSAAPSGAGTQPEGADHRRKASPSGRTPSIFVAHGAPPLLDTPAWVKELGDWARVLPKPTSVLMFSAHWDARPITLGATRTVPLVYDFYGFPQRYYEMTYPAPGAPDLAERVRRALSAHGLPFAESDRGLDHGAYVPLMCMYPKADVPVLQVSLPGLDPKTLLALGKTLAPLRDEGVLIVGSGFITHNLRAGFLEQTPSWAAEFDAWAKAALERWDVDALMDFRAKGPGVQMALPTVEHYVPLLVAAGAAADHPGAVSFPISGFWFGSFTRRSVQFD